VLLLGALAYGSALGGGFVFDDITQILENPAVRDVGGFFRPGGAGHPPNRWFGYLTFALNHAATGLDPVGWHVVNVAIHLASAALLWTLVRLAFRAPRLRGSALAPASGAVAFAASALFATHPMATQAVSYVVQRLTSLATLLYLLATVLWVAWRLAAGRRGRAWLYAGVVAAALLAVRTKEIAFTLPVALVLVDLALFPGGWRRLLPVAPVALAALLIPLSLLDLGGPRGSLLASADASTRVTSPAAGRHDYLRTQAVVITRYLGMMAVPVGQAIDHDVAIRRSWLAPDVAASVLLLGGLLGVAAWLAWRSSPRGGRPALDPAVRLVALGIAWFFLALSVESSIVPIADVMNEHRVYLPSAGLFVAVAVLAGLAVRRVDPRRTSRDLVALAGVASCVLALVTWNRNAAWRDEVSLWRDAAAKSPGLYRPLANLGAALLKQGRHAEAVAPLAQAARIDPRSVAAHVQLGVVLYLAGDPRGSEAELRRAVELDPSSPDALLNLSVLLGATGRRPEARPYLERLRQTATDPADRAWAEAELAR
jgi:hypothetical protein